MKPGEPENHQSDANRCLILRLELYSSVSLGEMKDFYHHLLGLPVVGETHDKITISAGQTLISFLSPITSGERPFYHFAFNIPENKLLSAYQWFSPRVSLLPIPPNLQDQVYPSDVVNYSHWNAHSLFFFDPGGNVVELIARHDLKNSAQGDYNHTDIQCVSEIAFVVDDVLTASRKLREVAGIGLYKGESDQFAALGDEHGLLIVMKRGRVISFAAEERKSVSVFPTSVFIRGDRHTSYEFPTYPYIVNVEDGSPIDEV